MRGYLASAAPVEMVCIQRSGVQIRQSLAWLAACLPLAWIMAQLIPGLRARELLLVTALTAVAACVLGLVVWQQRSSRWCFDGRRLCYQSVLFMAEYDVSEFGELRARPREHHRVLALRFASAYRHGELLELSFKEWGRQPLCRLVAAVLRSTPAIRVSPGLEKLIFERAADATSAIALDVHLGSASCL
jgi:hypothetical protein